MIIIYEGIELMASYIEMFVLYKIHSILLHKQRGNQSEKVDVLLAFVGAVIVRFCNHVSSFSYFTMLFFVLYVSISAAFLYKAKYISLFSIASFYLLCLTGFDFLVFTCVSSFNGGYETFVSLISTMGVSRMVIIFVVKLLWILAYLLLKKYLYKFSLKKNYVYTILAVSGTGFLGFVY